MTLSHFTLIRDLAAAFKDTCRVRVRPVVKLRPAV